MNIAMRTFFQDLGYGFRTLMNSPGFTVVALITLTLGIGANTAIFSVVNAVLLQSLPFRDPGKLTMIWEDVSKDGFPANTPAPANYAEWKRQDQIFSGVAALKWQVSNLTGDGEPEKLEGERVSYNLLSVLGVQPVMGRGFTPDEDREGGHKVVLISNGLWKRRFASDPHIVGQSIRLDNVPHTVIGVMPAGFSFPQKGTEVWTPIAFSPAELAVHTSHYLKVVARLRDGVSPEQANAELKLVRDNMAKQYPDSMRIIDRFYVEPLQDAYTRDVRRGLIVLLIAVGCILLIACANMANLLLSRSTGRYRELAVRTALGANRWRIVRQLLTESVLLALAGGALALILAEWCFAFLKNLVPADLSQTVVLTLDWRVLGFTAAASLAASILFGLAPALQAARVDLNDILKEGGRSGIGTRRTRLRNVLVVSEVALSLVLLVGSILLIRSFSNLRGLDPGFRAGNVLTMRINASTTKYGDFEKRTQFFEEVLTRLRTLPAVQNAGMTSALPLTWKGGTNSFERENRPQQEGETMDACDRVVSPGYFEAMRIPLIRGRSFNEGDGEHSMPVAIINETMAKTYWPGGDALGRRMRMDMRDSKGPWVTIVGVSHDVRQMGLDQPVKAEMYFPMTQSGYNWMIPRDVVIRTASDPLRLASAARQAVWSIDPEQPVSNVQTLNELLDDEVQNRRVQVTLLGALAGLAILLACVGIYGVLSYSVAARTQEIGVRVALGADSGNIWLAVARQGLVLTGVGLVTGLLLAISLTRLLSSLLFGITPNDVVTYFLASLLFAVVGVLACSIPAYRASRVDPMVALRYE